MSDYACMGMAVSALGGRCRNRAVASGFCLNPHEPGDPKAPISKLILLNLWLSNSTLHREAEELGFSTRNRSLEGVQERHELESGFLKRSIHRYREGLGDNGSSVFGKAQLANVVDLHLLVSEFKGAGFRLMGLVRGENTSDGGKQGVRLVMQFLHESVPPDAYWCTQGENTPEQDAFLRMLLRMRWVKTSVFENVPRYYVRHNGLVVQFQLADEPPVEDAKSVFVQMLRPKTDVLMEMDIGLFRQAVHFPAATVNCRIPFGWDKGHPDLVHVRYASGYWSAEPRR